MKTYLPGSIELNEQVDWLDEVPLWSAPFGIKLLEKVKYRRGITALDIGFGTGFPLIELAMRLGISCEVYGIDPWKEAVAKAGRRAEVYGITNVHIIEGRAEEIPLEADSIDLIVSNNGINNVRDIAKVFSECRRVMKKGGQLVITMNLADSMIEFYNVFEQVLKEKGMEREVEAIHRHIALKRPPLEHVIGLAQKNGFLILNSDHDQFYFRYADGTAMLDHHFIRLAFMDSWMELLREDKRIEIFNLIEQRLNEQAEKQGGLVLSIPFVTIDAMFCNINV